MIDLRAAETGGLSNRVYLILIDRGTGGPK